MQDIKKFFNKAALSLFLTDRPIAQLRENANEIFQMTIDSRNHSEQFRIFLGRNNDIRVLDYDLKRKQILLFVKEPKRRFTEIRFDRLASKNIETEHTTPGGIRRFLLGKDESHLFISELPDKSGKINKVDDAFRILKPFEVKDRKKRRDKKVHRQGEFFFLEATLEELLLIKENMIKLVTKATIPVDRTQSNPHTAENLLIVGDKIFVKGKICHTDHKTKNFFTWHRVFKNTERINPNNRIGWID